jgi:signal transduction histidine kinase/DNA-binding response OmpR family regulator
MTDGLEILIVEDSPTQAVQLEYILEQANYRVSVVRNGQEALKWLGLHRPALVITDILMPEMDGYELCRQVKTNPDFKSIPIILLTSLADAEDVLKGLGCGADSFIVKPYEEQNLLSQVQRAMANPAQDCEHEAEAGVEIDFAGSKCLIRSSKQKILNLLLSTYETAVQKNLELIRTQKELKILNEHLEERVKQRTAALTAEIVERKRAEGLLRLDEARFKALLELGQLREAPSKAVAEFALEQAIQLTSSKIGFIGFMNEDETVSTLQVWTKSVMEACTIPVESLHFPVAEAGLWADPIRKREAMVVNDYSAATPGVRGYPSGHVSLSRLMVVPVYQRDRIVALAAVANKDKDYDPSDLRQMTLLMDGMWKLVQHNLAEEALRQSEERLRNSNALLQEVFDGISDPLIMLDDQMLVKLLNQAARAYFGLTEDEDVFGRPCYEALRKMPTACADCLYPFPAKGGQPFVFERKGIIDPNRFEQVVVYPVVNITGERQAVIIRISDITQSKLLERQLIQSEKLASIGLLVSGVAHEINNPNSFMSFNIPILRDYLEALLPIIDGYAEEHPDFEVFSMNYQEFRQDIFGLLDNMEHGSNRINRIVSDLKDYARKRDKSELRWIDLKMVITKAVNICRSEIRKKINSFEVQIAEDMPRIFSDPEALEQVLINLLINAVHASDKGESWIRVHAACERSWDRYCVIEVSDNGGGVAEDIRDKIFDPFFTTKASSAGTGLGLYICYNLVEALGGKIEIESKPDQGSTFRIVLPQLRTSESDEDTLE